jgi:hypothetical protein
LKLDFVLLFLLSLALGALFTAWATALTYRLATGVLATWPKASLGTLVLAQIVVTCGALLGILLLFVPGIYWSLLTSAVLPVVLIERESVFGAIQRSAVLTRGRRLAIFGYWLAWSLPLMVATIGVEQLLVDWRGFEAADASPLVVNWARPLAVLITGIANAFFTASLYCELRELADQQIVQSQTAL